MMKKLKQEENKDKQNPERKSDNKDEVLSSKSFYATVHINTIEIKTIYPISIAGEANDIPQSFFHPPTV